MNPDDASYTFSEVEAAVRHFVRHYLSLSPELQSQAVRFLDNPANLREALRTQLRSSGAGRMVH